MYSFNIMFDEVAGLAAGDKVTVAGLNAGEILSLSLAPFGKVVAVVEVDDQIKIPVDSRITVASYGLIGAKVISIRPGASHVYIAPGSVNQGQYEKGLGDVVHEMGEALADIRIVMKSADDILTDEEGKVLVKDALVNANAASSDLKRATEDLRAMASELRTFVGDEARACRRTPSMRWRAPSIGFVGGDGGAQDRVGIARFDRAQSRGRTGDAGQAHQRGRGSRGVPRRRSRRSGNSSPRIRDNPKSFVKFSLF